VLLLSVALTLSGCASAAAPDRVGNDVPPAPPVPSHAAATTRPVLDRKLVATASWMQTSQGFRLRVRPTLYGRNHASQGPDVALREAIVAARPTPLTLSSSIRRSLLNQLRCHAVFAAAKPTWDLETWRPDVGFTKTVLAECNPTG
jgi:hypothetical protein